MLLLLANVAAPVSAITGSVKYQSTSYELSRSFGDLRFSGVEFLDFTDTTVQGFGLSGKIYNSADVDLKYTATVTYYDSYNHTVATSTITKTAPVGSSSYTQMSSTSSLADGYTASNIKKYDLVVDVQDEEEIDSDYFADSDVNKTPSKNSVYKTNDYVIDAYDVDITVHEDNTFDVVEEISAYFFASYKHGIIRSLPLRNEFVRTDGSSSKSRALITNVSVDGDLYSQSREDGELKIKIGSASAYVHGPKKYTIKYTYNFGEDKSHGFDEFYYNIIGSEWDTVIGNVTFNVHMPKEFDAAKVGFSSGAKYSTNNDSVIYTIKDNDISGSYNGILGKYEGLTVRVTLDDGYFATAQSLIQPWEYLIFIVPAVGVLIVFVLWLIFGNDERAVDDLQYYPPEGMNSLDMAFAYKGKVDGKDVVSLLLHLANQGYIKIVETSSSSSLSRSNFKIVKMKEYDGKDENEEVFMAGLFRGSSRRRTSSKTLAEIVKSVENGGMLTKKDLEKAFEEDDGLEETTSSRLRYSFYRTINRITTAVNKKENRKKYFTNTSFASIMAIICIIVSAFTLIAVPANANSDIEATFLLVIVMCFYAPFFAVGFSKGVPIVFRIIWLGFTTIHFGAMMLSGLAISDVFETDSFYVYGLTFGIACIVIQALFLKFMPKRTAHGLEVYGKIKGFKKFLETAEKDRLERLMAEKPNYAYDILPYAYVLGVSTKWMKKFESLTMSPPDWYDGYSTGFTMSHFNSFISHTMTTSSSAMTSSPSSSGGGGGFSGGGGGGGSSGGGSSGGGGGGGGGSSW